MGPLASIQIRDKIRNSGKPLDVKKEMCAIWFCKCFPTDDPFTLSNLTEDIKTKFGFYGKGPVREPARYREYKQVAKDKQEFKSEKDHREAVMGIVTSCPQVRGFDQIKRYIACHNDGRLERLITMKKDLQPQRVDEIKAYNQQIYKYKTSYLGIFSKKWQVNAEEVGLNI